MAIKITKKYGKSFVALEHAEGKHRELELCQHCKLYKPRDVQNCQIMQNLYTFGILNGIIAVVLECAKYQEKK